MDAPSILPDVSLAIKLTNSTGDPGAARAPSLLPELQRLELPAIWIVDHPAQARELAGGKLAQADFELALAVHARTPPRLRTELATLQQEVRASLGQGIAAAVGNAQELRSRAAVLADFGICAVLSDARDSAAGKPPRLLPCGLWQFQPACHIPYRSRGLWSFLPARRPILKQMLATAAAGNPQVIAIDCGQLGRRELDGCVSLLREIAEARRRQQIRVAKISALATELTSRNAVKPQRSILRRAA